MGQVEAPKWGGPAGRKELAASGVTLLSIGGSRFVTQLAKPFGDDWRTLWRVRGTDGEQWIVHVSGLTVTPVFGVVEDDGFKAWTLHVQPGDVFKLDGAMRRRLGQKAW